MCSVTEYSKLSTLLEFPVGLFVTAISGNASRVIYSANIVKHILEVKLHQETILKQANFSLFKNNSPFVK